MHKNSNTNVIRFQGNVARRDDLKDARRARFEWEEALMSSSDPELRLLERRVAFVISRSIDDSIGRTKFPLSDRTIADKLGLKSRPEICRTRAKLRSLGWINWKQSRTANFYTLALVNVGPILDLNRERAEDRRAMHQELQDPINKAYRKPTVAISKKTGRPINNRLDFANGTERALQNFVDNMGDAVCALNRSAPKS